MAAKKGTRAPQILELQAQGKTNREIAKILGIRYNSVFTCLSRYNRKTGVTKSTKRKLTRKSKVGRQPATAENLQSCLKLKADGLSVKQIASELKLTDSQVSYLLYQYRHDQERKVVKANKISEQKNKNVAKKSSNIDENFITQEMVKAAHSNSGNPGKSDLLTITLLLVKASDIAAETRAKAIHALYTSR